MLELEGVVENVGQLNFIRIYMIEVIVYNIGWRLCQVWGWESGIGLA